ncbi:MAG: hypothetical protein Q9203_007209 [Teloschistes exilis]
MQESIGRVEEKQKQMGDGWPLISTMATTSLEPWLTAAPTADTRGRSAPLNGTKPRLNCKMVE